MEDGNKGFISLGTKHAGSDQRPMETSILSPRAACSIAQKGRGGHGMNVLIFPEYSFRHWAMSQGIPEPKAVIILSSHLQFLMPLVCPVPFETMHTIST